MALAVATVDDVGSSRVVALYTVVCASFAEGGGRDGQNMWLFIATAPMAD